MDPAAISAGSKRLYSSDTEFKKCLICQLCKNDPLYKLTAAGLDNFKTALYERKDHVYRATICFDTGQRQAAVS